MFDQGQIIATAARTATPTPVTIAIPDGAEALEVVVNTSAAGVSPSTTFNIDFPDGDGGWASVLVSAAVTATGVTRLRVGAEMVNVANVAQQGVLPSLVRVRPVHGNATSHTYSVSFWLR
jgi:hypothetical protein